MTYDYTTLKSVPMRQIIENYGITVSRYNRAVCPFHDAKTPSECMQVFRDGFKCYSCGVHGDQIDFVAMYEHIPPEQAAQRVAAIGGMNGTNGREALRKAAERTRRRVLVERKRNELDELYQIMCENRHAMLKLLDICEPMSDEWCAGMRVLERIEADIDEMYEELCERQ